MQSKLAVHEADVKLFSQQLAQINQDISKDFSDPNLASNNKVKLEAQVIQTTKQASSQAEISTKLLAMKELNDKMNSE